jgi:hypothetical protein
MNRRFNSTGRLRIPRDLVALRVVEDPAGGPAHFTADLSGLNGLGLNPAARVIVEPYHRQSSMRFDFGSLAAPSTPSDTRLSEIDRGESVQFRVKVVDPDGRPGRLLALAARVRPLDEDEAADRKSILPLESLDLGEAIWRVRVDEDESPVLQINSRVPDLRARLDDDPVLRGAVFPMAIREVLRVILHSDVDPDLEWVRDWREFAGALFGEALPGETLEPEAGYEITEKVVEEFCIRERWASDAQPREIEPVPDYE